MSILEKLPRGWRLVALGDVCKVVGGTTPSTSIGDYWGGDVVWVTPKDMGKLSESEIEINSSGRKITQDGLNSCNLIIVPKNSIVISTRAPIGYVAVAGVPLCTNQGCRSLVLTDKVRSKFLYFALIKSVEKLQSLGSGSTFGELSKTKLESFQIPLPPLGEQKRIVAALERRFSIVEKMDAAVYEQAATVAALQNSFLRGAIPAADGRLPKGWRSAELGDVCEMVTDKPQKYDGTKKYFATGDIKNGVQPTFTAVEFNSRPSRADIYPAINDIGFAKMKGTNKVVCADKSMSDSIFSTGFAFLRAGGNVAPGYLHCLVLSQWFQCVKDSLTADGIMSSIKKDDILGIKIPIPPLVEQKKIAAKLEKQFSNVEKLRRAVDEKRRTINALRGAFLRRAFRGKI